MSEIKYVPVRILEGLRYKIIDDHSVLTDLSKAIKSIGGKVVVTIGTWDALHVGHARYVRRASEEGNILIVGVDTDRAVKLYKDSSRPLIPYDERAEMLTHLRYVDFVTPVDDVELRLVEDEKGKMKKKPFWKYELIKAVRPDIFIAVLDSYPDWQLEEIRKYVGEIKVLQRQAETSTSAIIRKRLIADAKKKGGGKKK